MSAVKPTKITDNWQNKTKQPWIPNPLLLPPLGPIDSNSVWSMRPGRLQHLGISLFISYFIFDDSPKSNDFYENWIKIITGTGGKAQVVRAPHLPSKPEALSSNHSAAKKKKKKIITALFLPAFKRIHTKVGWELLCKSACCRAQVHTVQEAGLDVLLKE
jgi:hypothetical protein